MERLYELHASGDYDVVVVDTPPTRNALSLLDAPHRLTALFEHRLFRALLMPTRASVKLFSIATRRVLSTISAAAGAELVGDAVDFLQAFTGMEEGFTERASAMGALLKDPATAYVVVTAPRADAVAEARFFADQLANAARPVAAVVLNKLHADPGGPIDPEVAAGDPTLVAQIAAANRLHEGAVAERALLADILDQVDGAAVVALPLLERPAGDLATLALLGAALSERSSTGE
jgi:anion-transporting  ArsA/GET3 family ATPase